MKNTHPESSVLKSYCLQFLQWLQTSASEMFLALALAVHLRIRIISQLSEPMPWQPETCVYTVWGEQWEPRGDTVSAAYLTCRAGNCTGSHSPGRCSGRHSGRGCCNTHLSGHCRWHPCTLGCRCRCRNQSHPDTGRGGKDQGHSCRCSHHTTHQWILGRNFTKEA